MAVMTPQTTGCASFRVIDGTLPTRAESVDPELELRVTTTDGASVDLHIVWRDSEGVRGSLAGRPRGDESREQFLVEIPWDEVERIEARKTDYGKTAALGLGAYLGLSLIAAIVLLTAALNALESGQSVQPTETPLGGHPPPIACDRHFQHLYGVGEILPSEVRPAPGEGCRALLILR
jgi:hypothetical protein